MQYRHSRGYTLIEIMLAVAILSILTAIAIQAYDGYIGEARIGTAIKDIRQAELILDDLASDANLQGLDGNTTTVLGLYLDSGELLLANPATTPAGTTPWLDPWDRIYRYQRSAAAAGGVRTDGGGSISNDAANSIAPQAYDLFSLGADGTANNGDDVVRGCNGAFVGLDADHPTC
ncbi:MAG: prepilin-type N-terminal cleavage/methylation domain-containing protein [Gammaproteobacteria bacterium]|nr:prepilin-type N-terminal cleavage/methylation domain-containing protein [Gammaproteobacteria bacterium]